MSIQIFDNNVGKNGYLPMKYSNKKKTKCEHCEIIRDNKRGSANYYPRWSVVDINTGIALSKIYQPSSKFRYAFNIILAEHRTDNDIYDMLESALAFRNHLQRVYQLNTRVLMNNNTNINKFGGKEHQHIWVVVTDEDRYDEIFGTINGVSRPQDPQPIEELPYPTDYVFDTSLNDLMYNSRDMIRFLNRLKDRKDRQYNPLNNDSSFFVFIDQNSDCIVSISANELLYNKRQKKCFADISKSGKKPRIWTYYDHNKNFIHNLIDKIIHNYDTKCNYYDNQK